MSRFAKLGFIAMLLGFLFTSGIRAEEKTDITKSNPAIETDQDGSSNAHLSHSDRMWLNGAASLGWFTTKLGGMSYATYLVKELIKAKIVSLEDFLVTPTYAMLNNAEKAQGYASGILGWKMCLAISALALSLASSHALKLWIVKDFHDAKIEALKASDEGSSLSEVENPDFLYYSLGAAVVVGGVALGAYRGIAPLQMIFRPLAAMFFTGSPAENLEIATYNVLGLSIFQMSTDLFWSVFLKVVPPYVVGLTATEEDEPASVNAKT